MNSSAATPGFSAWALFLLLLLCASGLQSVVASSLSYQGGNPDFLLTVALSAALLSDARTGCVTGLCAGILSATLLSKTAGTLLVSRTIAGFVAGSITARMFRGNLGVVLVGVFLASVAAEVVYGLSAPRIGIRHWLFATFIGAAMNALLSLPVTFVLRRAGWGGRA